MPPPKGLLDFLDQPTSGGLLDFLDVGVAPPGAVEDPNPQDPFGISTFLRNTGRGDAPPLVRKDFKAPPPISGEQDFLRGLIERAQNPFPLVKSLEEQGVTPPQRAVEPVVLPNKNPDIGDRLAQGAGEFFPEIAGGAATPAALGAGLAQRALVGGAEAAAQDIAAGRSPSEIALGTVAGAAGAALLGRPGGKAAGKTLRQFLDDAVAEEVLEKGVLPFAREDLLRFARAAKNTPSVPENTRAVAEAVEGELKQLNLQGIADEAQLAQAAAAAAGRGVQTASGAIDIIEQAGRASRTVAESVEAPSPQRLLPPGSVRSAAKLLPEFTERRAGLRLLSTGTRKQRLLTAGNMNMEIVRAAIGVGDTQAFRTSLSSLGLSADEAESVIQTTLKDLRKARKGKFASKEQRGDAFLKTWDDLTRAPENARPGGSKTRLLDNPAGDVVENARKVEEGFEQPGRIDLAEANEIERRTTGDQGPFFRKDPTQREAGFAVRQTDLLDDGPAFRAPGSKGRPFSALKISDIIIQKVLRASKLKKPQIEEFINRMTAEERLRMAVEIETSRSKATAIGANAIRAQDPSVSFIAAQGRVRRALEKSNSKLGVFMKNEDGFVRLSRMWDATPPKAQDTIKQAIEITEKATKGRTKKILEATWYNALLSRPFGRFKDMASSALNVAGQTGGRFVRNPRAALAQFNNRAQGHALVAAAPHALEGFRTGMIKTIRDMATDGELPEELAETALRLDQFDGPTFVQVLKQIPFTPQRINAMGDDFFFMTSYMMEKNFLSMQKALRSGKRGAALEDLFERILREDDLLDQQAMEMGRRAVFREKKLNKFSGVTRGIGKAVREIPVFGRYFGAPFVRTPAAVAGRAFETVPNPLTIMGIGRDALKALATGDEVLADRALQGVIRQAVGGMALYAGVDYAAQGRLTGRGDHLSPAEKDAMIRAGTWRPNSFRLGDRWIPYSGIGPISAWASVAANMHELHLQGKLDPATAPITLTYEAIRGAINATFLPGFARVVDSIQNPQKYGDTHSERVANVFGAIGLADAVATAIDPERREPQTIKEGLLAVTPGLRERVPIKAGTFGEASEELQNPFVNVFFPRIGKVSEDPLIMHLASVDALPGRPALPQVPEGLSREQANAFRFDRGEANNVRLIKGKLEREIIERVIGNSGGLERFAQKDPEVQKRIVARARSLQNVRVNRIIRNLRLTGQPITERAVRDGIAR